MEVIQLNWWNISTKLRVYLVPLFHVSAMKTFRFKSNETQNELRQELVTGGQCLRCAIKGAKMTLTVKFFFLMFFRSSSVYSHQKLNCIVLYFKYFK